MRSTLNNLGKGKEVTQIAWSRFPHRKLDDFLGCTAQKADLMNALAPLESYVIHADCFSFEGAALAHVRDARTALLRLWSHVLKTFDLLHGHKGIYYLNALVQRLEFDLTYCHANGLYDYGQLAAPPPLEVATPVANVAVSAPSPTVTLVHPSYSVPGTCSKPGCALPGRAACPTCRKLNLPAFWFCSQLHCNDMWPEHAKAHVAALRPFQPEPFNNAQQMQQPQTQPQSQFQTSQPQPQQFPLTPSSLANSDNGPLPPPPPPPPAEPPAMQIQQPYAQQYAQAPAQPSSSYSSQPQTQQQQYHANGHANGHVNVHSVDSESKSSSDFRPSKLTFEQPATDPDQVLLISAPGLHEPALPSTLTSVPVQQPQSPQRPQPRGPMQTQATMSHRTAAAAAALADARPTTAPVDFILAERLAPADKEAFVEYTRLLKETCALVFTRLTDSGASPSSPRRDTSPAANAAGPAAKLSPAQRSYYLQILAVCLARLPSKRPAVLAAVNTCLTSKTRMQPLSSSPLTAGPAPMSGSPTSPQSAATAAAALNLSTTSAALPPSPMAGSEAGLMGIAVGGPKAPNSPLPPPPAPPLSPSPDGDELLVRGPSSPTSAGAQRVISKQERVANVAATLREMGELQEAISLQLRDVLQERRAHVQQHVLRGPDYRPGWIGSAPGVQPYTGALITPANGAASFNAEAKEEKNDSAYAATSEQEFDLGLFEDVAEDYHPHAQLSTAFFHRNPSLSSRQWAAFEALTPADNGSVQNTDGVASVVTQRLRLNEPDLVCELCVYTVLHVARVTNCVPGAPPLCCWRSLPYYRQLAEAVVQFTAFLPSESFSSSLRAAQNTLCFTNVHLLPVFFRIIISLTAATRPPAVVSCFRAFSRLFCATLQGLYTSTRGKYTAALELAQTAVNGGVGWVNLLHVPAPVIGHGSYTIVPRLPPPGVICTITGTLVQRELLPRLAATALCDETFFRGLSICLQSSHHLVLNSALGFLYSHVNELHGCNRLRVFRDLLFAPNIFFPLFCHWNHETRKAIQFIMLHKSTRCDAYCLTDEESAAETSRSDALSSARQRLYQLECEQKELPEQFDNKVVAADGPWRKPLEARRRSSAVPMPTNITGTNSTLNFFALPEDDHSSGADRMGAGGGGPTPRFDSTRDMIASKQPKAPAKSSPGFFAAVASCCCPGDVTRDDTASIQMTERRRPERGRPLPPVSGANNGLTGDAANSVTLPEETQPEFLDVFGEVLNLHRAGVFILCEEQQKVDQELDLQLGKLLDALRIFASPTHANATDAARAAGIDEDFGSESDVSLSLSQLRRNCRKSIRELLNSVYESRDLKKYNRGTIERVRQQALNTSPIAFAPPKDPQSPMSPEPNRAKYSSQVLGVRLYPLFVPDKDREVSVESFLTKEELAASIRRGSTGGNHE